MNTCVLLSNSNEYTCLSKYHKLFWSNRADLIDVFTERSVATVTVRAGPALPGSIGGRATLDSAITRVRKTAICKTNTTLHATKPQPQGPPNRKKSKVERALYLTNRALLSVAYFVLNGVTETLSSSVLRSGAVALSNTALQTPSTCCRACCPRRPRSPAAINYTEMQYGVIVQYTGSQIIQSNRCLEWPIGMCFLKCKVFLYWYI